MLVLVGEGEVFQVNKIEKGSSDQHQISLAGGGVPYHVTYPVMHLILAITPPMDRQTPPETLPSRNFVCGW